MSSENTTDNFYTEDQNLDDVLSMELDEIEKDIPVDQLDAEYLLSPDEEKQLQDLLKKKSQSDFIMQTFKALEKRPTDADIDEFKGKHGDVYLVSLSEKENFIFRPLKRKEWSELMQRFEKAKLPDRQRTEGIVMAGVVWPILNQANINILTAGAPETIRNLILEASNFMEPERAVTLVRKL